MLVLLPNRLQPFIHKHLEGRVLCIRKAVFEKEHASRMILCMYICPLLMIHLRIPSWKYIMHLVCHNMWHVSYQLQLLPIYIHMHKPKHVLQLIGNRGWFIVEVVQEGFIHTQGSFTGRFYTYTNPICVLCCHTVYSPSCMKFPVFWFFDIPYIYQQILIPILASQNQDQKWHIAYVAGAWMGSYF